MHLLPRKGPGRPRTKAPEIRVTVYSTDYHIPFHDVAAYRAFCHFLAYVRPDYHIVLGDFIDATMLSTFAKDPAEANRTEEELLTANAVLDELQAASPNTITKYVMGNHSKRLTKRLWDNPHLIPYLGGKTPLQLLANCLSLDERGIEYFDYPSGYDHFGIYCTHGEATGMHSSKKELETYCASGISGHTHKNRYWEKRGRNGVTQWWTIGGLCSRNVSYRPNNDWVQGIAISFQVVGTDVFTMLPITITKGQLIYDRHLFTQDGVFTCQ